MTDLPQQRISTTNTIGVLVTTYQRPAYLARCLNSLLAQALLPEAIYVVYRSEDLETADFLQGFQTQHSSKPQLHLLTVTEAGVVAANNRALPEITTDLLAFIDDDAEANPDWLASIATQFGNNPKLGALGGRDILMSHGEPLPVTSTDRIGGFSWCGRISGNHHCPTPRKHPFHVKQLKGVNMAFRRRLLPNAIDRRIGGNGCFYEMDLCLHVAHQGYEIVYDPALTVKHHLDAPHQHPDSTAVRDGVNDAKMSAYLYNRMLVVAKDCRRQGMLVGLPLVLWMLICHLLLWMPAYLKPRIAMGGYFQRFGWHTRLILSGWRDGFFQTEQS